MRYYDILPANQSYHGQQGLTYASEHILRPRSWVTILLRSKPVIGFVESEVNQPNFKVKSIGSALDIKPLPKASLELLKWLRQYYPAPLGTIINQFVPGQLKPRDLTEKSIEVIKNIKLPPLTSDQQQVLMKIEKSPQTTFLLHGETGTGKTRVYIELAKEQLGKGLSTLVLTPEIGLTPQLVKDFEQVFGHKVIVIHSNLTPKQRQESWLRVLNSDNPLIVIGPRSALFSPFNKLGLIVVDEAHDSAYKQEQAPYYQALRVAGQLAKIHNAKLIVGSATPNVSDYFVAKAKQTSVLRMKQLAVNKNPSKPKYQIIDSRDKSLFTLSPYISNQLLNKIEKSLINNEQSLIFLNRRGTARVILCQNCGWQALCPNCDLPLTYHGDNHIMRCHTCGHHQKAPGKCPICASLDIIYKSAGTKSVAEALTKFFPRTKIMRFDTDNKKVERFEQHYHNITSGKVNIIVGTQIITKGLDLPKLSLVGVLAADSSLSFPDYTAEERTFQQLSQILGRIGRGHRAGTAIIQTYQPDSPLINDVLNKDWESFYKSQIREREQFLFPPFCFLLKLTVRRKTIKSAQVAAQNLAEELKKQALKIKIVGPSPSFYEKTKQGYTWQLIIKAKDRSQLLEIIKLLPSGWSYDLDPSSLL